jgi:CD80-like C2-set immunoglobulin domain
VRPLTVKIIQDLKFMSTKQSYDLRCEVRGSRPAPRVSWWLGSLQLTASKETVGIQTRPGMPTNEIILVSQFNYFYAHKSANLIAVLLRALP